MMYMYNMHVVDKEQKSQKVRFNHPFSVPLSHTRRIMCIQSPERYNINGIMSLISSVYFPSCCMCVSGVVCVPILYSFDYLESKKRARKEEDGKLRTAKKHHKLLNFRLNFILFFSHSRIYGAPLSLVFSGLFSVFVEIERIC